MLIFPTAFQEREMVGGGGSPRLWKSSNMTSSLAWCMLDALVQRISWPFEFSVSRIAYRVSRTAMNFISTENGMRSTAYGKFERPKNSL
jgi:hypothetical protein